MYDVCKRKVLESLKENTNDWKGALYSVKMLLFPLQPKCALIKIPPGLFKEMIQVEP